MKNHVQSGMRMTFTAAAVVASGQAVVIGSIVGFSVTDVPTGEEGTAVIEEVFSYSCLGSDDIGQGDLVYFDAANDRFTSSAAGTVKAGIAFAASGAGVDTINVKLTPGVG